MFGSKDKGSPKPSESTILGNFALQAQLPNGRSINITGYVFENESLESLNERLDLFQDAIERQRNRCEVDTLEAALKQRMKALEDYRDHLTALEKKQKAVGQSLSSAEKMQLNNANVNINKMLEDIEKGKEAIAEAKEKGGLAPARKQAGARS